MYLFLQFWLLACEYFNLLLSCTYLEKYIWEKSTFISKNDDNNEYFLPQKIIYILQAYSKDQNIGDLSIHIAQCNSQNIILFTQ